MSYIFGRNWARKSPFGFVAMQLTPGRLDIVCQRLGWDGLGFQRAFDKAVKQRLPSIRPTQERLRG